MPKIKKSKKQKKNKVVKPPKNEIIPKKRGRKPKGGKIVKKQPKGPPKQVGELPSDMNIILHLKCSSVDLTDSGAGIADMYKSGSNDAVSSFMLNGSKQQRISCNTYGINSPKLKVSSIEGDADPVMKSAWEKLKVLQFQLHTNDVESKRSNCFWCTYPFDNPPIYIPRQERKGTIEAYGCFCSPECAVAHLKSENIDSSTMWERYALLNNIYSKIYNYEKNIKPAPSPFYTLDKYYGNLTIQEYRGLLRNERLLLVVEKPLTKVLPELYEENNEPPAIYTDLLASGAPTGCSQYRLKRKQPKFSKKNILNSNFGIGV